LFSLRMINRTYHRSYVFLDKRFVNPSSLWV
jgi:hypothetical protein